jgi:hypothetical protein
MAAAQLWIWGASADKPSTKSVVKVAILSLLDPIVGVGVDF